MDTVKYILDSSTLTAPSTLEGAFFMGKNRWRGCKRNMKLNSDLFWELCKKYNVPLLQDYSDIMFKDKNGNVRVFRDDDIDRIFAS